MTTTSHAVAMLALLHLGMSGCATVGPEPDARASLVAAERAFARLAVEQGVRHAFLEHFAPEGLLFVPAPTPVREVFAQPPADPMATLLEWEPVASSVAGSGDFGFTTGPSRISRRDGSRPPGHSTFFSVWKRDAGGRWRVAIDAGVPTPGPVPHERLLPSPAVRAADPAAPGALDALLADERNGPWSAEAFLARLAPDALLQRAGAWPLSGAAAIAADWARDDETFTPLGGDIATSRDLAYTYGTLRTAQAAGHYVHLWTRDASGSSWRLAAALRLP